LHLYIYLFFANVTCSSPNHFRSHCWTVLLIWLQGEASPTSNAPCSSPTCPSTKRLHVYVLIPCRCYLFFAELSAKSKSSDNKIKFDSKRKKLLSRIVKRSACRGGFGYPHVRFPRILFIIRSCRTGKCL
jgi:hypothetical protein